MRTARRRILGPVALACLLSPSGTVAAQRAVAALEPDSATVGDVVRVAVRVALPPGMEAVFPEALALPEDMEAAGRRELTTDTVGGRTVTAVYPVTPWRPGDAALDTLTVAVRGAGEGILAVPLPTLHVTSVLPADTTGLEARPPRDVLGADRLWWPLLLALALLLLAGALALWLLRRHRRREAAPAPSAPAVDPREEALAALHEVARMPVASPAEVKFLHARLTAVLRRYTAAVRPAWSEDLTTSELTVRAGGLPALRPLLGLLAGADLVKFARHPATAEDTHGAVASAEAWVAGWPPPAPPDEVVERAA